MNTLLTCIFLNQLDVYATDGMSTSAARRCTITVYRNTNPPRITNANYEVTIFENITLIEEVFDINAEDADNRVRSLKYKFFAGFFYCFVSIVTVSFKFIR